MYDKKEPTTAASSIDTVYSMYLKLKLEKSQDDIKNGNVISLEELEKERKTLYENYFIKRSKEWHG